MQYQEVSAFDAKTHLSQLLTKVENGEQFTITRHKQPVAVLGPTAQNHKMFHRESMGAGLNIIVLEPLTNDGFKKSRIEAAHKLQEASKGLSLGGISIKELIEEGRRW